MSAAEKIDFQITPAAWFRQDLLYPVFGLSTEAVRKYRSRGLWLEGKHYRTDPANVLVYNKEAIENWMAGQP
ncbi:excisionase family protein [Pseudomonas atacamensis]|uniref:excisionase family protein n=1 Tax=Pseudomonas atacamensis TaxID=2565368 RepID=UPI0037F1D85A